MARKREEAHQVEFLLVLTSFSLFSTRWTWTDYMSYDITGEFMYFKEKSLSVYIYIYNTITCFIRGNYVHSQRSNRST